MNDPCLPPSEPSLKLNVALEGIPLIPVSSEARPLSNDCQSVLSKGEERTTEKTLETSSMTHDLKHYQKLKVVKDFSKLSRHAQGVYLLKEDVVRKTYPSRFTDVFWNEVRKMRRLEGCPFVPKLLAVDGKNLTFYMSYCGRPVDSLDPYRDEIREMLKILREEYYIEHNDVKAKNVCRLDDKLYLIDFGWARSFHAGKPGYMVGKLGHRDQVEADKVESEGVREWLAEVVSDPETRIRNAHFLRLQKITGWQIPWVTKR